MNVIKNIWSTVTFMLDVTFSIATGMLLLLYATGHLKIIEMTEHMWVVTLH